MKLTADELLKLGNGDTGILEKVMKNLEGGKGKLGTSDKPNLVAFVAVLAVSTIDEGTKKGIIPKLVPYINYSIFTSQAAQMIQEPESSTEGNKRISTVLKKISAGMDAWMKGKTTKEQLLEAFNDLTENDYLRIMHVLAGNNHISPEIGQRIVKATIGQIDTTTLLYIIATSFETTVGEVIAKDIKKTIGEERLPDGSSIIEICTNS